jgi:hypothetical protein
MKEGIRKEKASATKKAKASEGAEDIVNVLTSTTTPEEEINILKGLTADKIRNIMKTISPEDYERIKETQYKNLDTADKATLITAYRNNMSKVNVLPPLSAGLDVEQPSGLAGAKAGGGGGGSEKAKGPLVKGPLSDGVIEGMLNELFNEELLETLEEAHNELKLTTPQKPTGRKPTNTPIPDPPFEINDDETDESLKNTWITHYKNFYKNKIDKEFQTDSKKIEYLRQKYKQRSSGIDMDQRIKKDVDKALDKIAELEADMLTARIRGTAGGGKR